MVCDKYICDSGCIFTLDSVFQHRIWKIWLATLSYRLVYLVSTINSLPLCGSLLADIVCVFGTCLILFLYGYIYCHFFLLFLLTVKWEKFLVSWMLVNTHPHPHHHHRRRRHPVMPSLKIHGVTYLLSKYRMWCFI